MEKTDVMSDGVKGIRHRLLLKATARTIGHERCPQARLAAVKQLANAKMAT